jgi:aspartyl-tRNA(Asn)/glutamyl-tRNA(Gln) amidotransferase subunit A
MPDDLPFASLSDVGERIRSREISSVELTEMMLARIEKHDHLNAYITVTPDEALRQARRADSEAPGGPLHGIPVAVKDLFDTAGIRTTAGTRHWENRVPREDATVVRRLKEAGAVILGKTGLHELAWGSTSINPHFGAIRNPWSRDHHPGGSSGGSAAAVAAGLAYAAIGSDTACSIRQPAHCCGIVGHKPTFGLVSKAGVIPLVWGLDHVGPITRSVDDAEILLRAMAGPDDTDPYSIDVAMREVPDLPEKATIAVPRQHFFEGGDPEVISIVDDALGVFRDLGFEVVEKDLPDAEVAWRQARMLFSEVAAAHEAMWREDPDGFSEEFARNMEMTLENPPLDYVGASHFRKGFTKRAEAFLGEFDAIVAPTSTVPAGLISGEETHPPKERWKNTITFNLTGQPSVSVPCGFTRSGLPVGLMITGRILDDLRVLQVARAFEQATPWHAKRPPL